MKGIGTTFERHNGTSFQTVAKVLEMAEVSLSRDTADQTTFDSAGGYREFSAGGLRDAGESSITLVWNPADTDHDGLRDDFESDAAVQYRVTWTDGSSFTCDGFVTGVGLTTPLEDGDVTAAITIKWTGQPTWA